MSRGEIWSVAGGVYAAKPRPAVVIQDDAFDATASVTVVPLTTAAVDDALVRVAVPAASATGIDHDSFAMADKITTVRRDQLGRRIGRLPTTVLLDLERAIVVFLGIAR